jgi:SET domain-containing protein
MPSNLRKRGPSARRSRKGARPRRASSGRRVAPTIDPRFTCFRLRLGRSRVDRYGVFACQPIPAGKKVIEYTGRYLSRRTYLREFSPLFRFRAPKRIYVMALTTNLFVDGAVNGSGAECINHSCDPNLSVRRVRGHLLLFSRRRIANGEELTFDYQLIPEAPRVRCRCGSPLCRGTLNLP